MTLGELLFNRLSQDATVAGLVGTAPVRIYPMVMPQGTAKPAIVYTVVSDTPENSFDGLPTGRTFASRVQVDAYASTYLAVQQLADAIINVLGGLQAHDLAGQLESKRDLYDDEARLFRVSSDFFLFR